ncbi:enoyl-CoA hydratase-related protein [Dokdonella sp.]|uniref:enoyl-CoA hydratase-related protein n=1 Tax=Dokdonella sp. TaxID=2291710 RepID=UPI003528882E
MSDSIRVANRNGICEISLDRPNTHNAFDDGLISELTAALQAANNDASIWGVVLTGEGKTFSAGADANWMRSMASASELENRNDSLRLAELMRTLNFLPKPTVARVNGSAYGGGVGLIACCDIAIGIDDAKFSLSEAKLGLVPAVISPYVVAAIGVRHARRLFVSAEIIDGEEAFRIGLLHKAVSRSELDNAVAHTLHHLRKCGAHAQAEAKALALRVAGLTREESLRIDIENAALIARLRVSEEGQEGLTAFLEKRPPRWISEG